MPINLDLAKLCGILDSSEYQDYLRTNDSFLPTTEELLRDAMLATKPAKTSKPYQRYNK